MKKQGRKINWLILALILAIPVLFVLSEWLFFGGGFKRIYYRHFCEPDSWQVVKDDDFPVGREGFVKKYKLSSDYYVPHRILLVPNCFDVPADYELKGQFQIDIFDEKGNLLERQESKKAVNICRSGKDDYYGNYMAYIGTQPKKAASIYGFEIGYIPFNLIRLKPGRTKNMEIEITVIEPAYELNEFCGEVSLLIIPDLRL
jgi:hypothetical protein